MAEPTTPLGLGPVFILLWVMLGPLKLLGPFSEATHSLDDAAVRRIALRASGVGLLALIAGGFLGRALLEAWHVSSVAMLLAAGVIFSIVGLRVVLEQYRNEPAEVAPALPANPRAAALRVAFPMVVTPYGIAAVIVLLANSRDSSRTAAILGIVTALMAIDLLAMLHARRIAGGPLMLPLRVYDTVMAVLQFAHGIGLIVDGLHFL